jgi:repressor LexA
MEKKQQIYEYIRDEVRHRGIPPTIREIGTRFNISSTNGVRYFLGKLEEEGLIKRQSWTARGIRLVERTSAFEGVAIPILGRVPAGKPVFSEEYVEGSILVDESIARGDGIFAVRVQGDSMIGAGINDGDIAVVRRDPYPENGKIVVALIEDEVTLKRLVKKGGHIKLRAENDRYPDIDLNELGHEQISVIGSVVAVIRRFY